MRRQRLVMFVQSVIVLGVSAAGVLGTAVNVRAQALKDVQTPDTPLVLKAQGSFYVGGEKVEQTAGELGDLGPGGHITRQSDVRALHGAAGRRWQRAGGDGAWRNVDGQILGDDAGRPHGMGRVLRAQGPSRLRSRSGRTRTIGIQSSHLQQRARGVGAGEHAAAMDSVQRRGGLAELPLRFEAWRSLRGQLNSR